VESFLQAICLISYLSRGT